MEMVTPETRRENFFPEGLIAGTWQRWTLVIESRSGRLQNPCPIAHNLPLGQEESKSRFPLPLLGLRSWSLGGGWSGILRNLFPSQEGRIFVLYSNSLCLRRLAVLWPHLGLVPVFILLFWVLESPGKAERVILFQTSPLRRALGSSIFLTNHF